MHDVEHAATPRDLEHIVAESRERGDLPVELSALLDRILDFQESTAEHAMIPRTRVTTIGADEPVRRAVALMASGHSRLPVLGGDVDGDVDDVVGVVRLREVLALSDQELDTTTVRRIARPPVMVPASLPLLAVLDQLRAADEEFACVVDEYGGLAGVVTGEDIAEELVGEITDEHDPLGTDQARPGEEGGWVVSGTMHIDEAERLLGHDLPQGDYQTLAGLVLTELQRLPVPGDAVTIVLPNPPGAPTATRPAGSPSRSARSPAACPTRSGWSSVADCGANGQTQGTARPSMRGGVVNPVLAIVITSA